MKAKDVFAEFFTNLLKIDNRVQAREIALTVWPGTRELWLHTMNIDPVLIELDLAKVMDDGRIGYRYFDAVDEKHVWEVELPTPEQETQLQTMADKRFVQTVVLQDGHKVSWDALKGMAQKEHLYFQIPEGKSDITFRIGPDHFPNSYVLAWVTLAEKLGGPGAYLDNRCRSNDPDDFLSRIAKLA